MLQIFSDINWGLIAVLIAISAFVAWVGDYVGMKLGKKRISLFNLRPKHTSRLITVFTGVGIAVVMFFALSMASESVRIALFNMNSIQAQIDTLTRDLHSSETQLSGMREQLSASRQELQSKMEEIDSVQKKLSEGQEQLKTANQKLQEMREANSKAAAEQKHLTSQVSDLKKTAAELRDESDALRRESDELRAGIMNLREGRISTFTGEILAQAVVTTTRNISDLDIDRTLYRLSEDCRTLLSSRFNVSSDSISMPDISEESVNVLRKKLKGTKGRYLVRLTSLTNAVAGESVATDVSVYGTKLVYRKGAQLGKITFEPGTNVANAERDLYILLKKINSDAASAGVMKDPITGNIGTIDAAEVSEAISKLETSSGPVALSLIAANDIYTEGPVTVSVKVE